MKVTKTILAALLFSQISMAATLNVRNFGAKGDGKTLDTKAIQAAVDECTKTGGKVLLSDGNFLTGTIYLKDNVTLFVETGSKILGSKSVKDYPVNDYGFRNIHEKRCNKALIMANEATNVGIEGGGIIDGQGAAIEFKITKTEWNEFNRPCVLWFKKCKKVNVEGVELRNSPYWMQIYMRCEDVRISNIKIFNHANYNNDMVDIDGCRNVLIDGVIGDSDDDGITFKSMDGTISENITVSNCILKSHCNGLKFGTEMSGGYRNVTITNCIIRSSEVDSVMCGSKEGSSAFSLEVVDGGLIENVNVSNLVIDGPRVPMYIRLGNRGRKYYTEQPTPGIGQIRNIQISNVIAKAQKRSGISGVGGITILGTPGGLIENISFSNIKQILPGGGTTEDANTVVPENTDKYPDASKHGTFSSYGVYARHVKGLTLSDMSFELLESDARPMIYLEDVHSAKVNGITEPINFKTDRIRIAKNCKNLSIQK